MNLVPHTHWDREWYLSFETFRDRLVATMDLILQLLEADPRWAHFHLDGQTAMIDDYLTVRPEAEGALRGLIAAGRLSCGPWVTLVDEFLVSGESIVRNLEDGMARALDLGAAPPFVGYLPDQFGHVGQMPQILAAAGIERVVTWRGVPGSVTSTRFTWTGVDGSSVEASYLPFGYGQGRAFETDGRGFLARVDREVTALEPFLAEGEPALITVGDDHEAPSPRLPDAVDEALSKGRSVRITSLREHLDEAAPAVGGWRGEMRSAARANLLPNTYSVRPQQKILRARAEHILERYAQPLAALAPGMPWPEQELARAWHLLHLNGAHDSVCGCSTDEVAAAVDARTDEVTAIAEAIALEAMERLAAEIPGTAPLVFNPSPFPRYGAPGLGIGRPTSLPAPEVAALEHDGTHFGIGGLRMTLDDTDDEGDLYNFSPASEPSVATIADAAEGAVVARVDGATVVVTAERTPGDPFAVLDLEIINERPDHRLRLILELPSEAATSRAGAPFEIVERPPIGEGGPGESASPWWPARGFVLAGGSGFLTDGVVEYELMPPRRLALTLMRCTGTISRPHAIPTREGPAGPDVATPGAQLIGTTHLRVGVALEDLSARPYEAWERFALPFLVVDSPGDHGDSPMRSLARLRAPTLSTIWRRGSSISARVFNPSDRTLEVHHEDRVLALEPFRIATVDLEGPAFA